MNRIFLKDVILNDQCVNIRIRGNVFESISAELVPENGEEVIDCARRFAVLPPFYNGHTHAAMTLFRGYADDYELFHWLNDYIWPAEAQLRREDVYNGTRLAILEMIKSGTVFFNDMYWLQKDTVRAAGEMGVRACIGIMRLSTTNADAPTRIDNDWLDAHRDEISDRIQISQAPHAIYTVKEPELRLTVAAAKKHDDIIHIHLSETKREFDDCVKEHGMTPTAYLDSVGMLTPKTMLAHSVHMTDADLDLIAKRGAVMVHNPVSNMKLTSGAFRHAAAFERGCRVILGTDGNASNNDISMLNEMKTASLLAKHTSGNPELLPASKMFDIATKCGAEAFGLHAGVIKEGYLADCMLVDLNNLALVPNYHLISNMVYSADPSCIDTVICDGKVLMRGRHVPHEEEIIDSVRASAEYLLQAVKK